MSSRSNGIRSAEDCHSHSTPQRQTKTDSAMRPSESCDVTGTGDSTHSLSPIYHDTFQSENEDDKSHSRILESESEAKDLSNETMDKGRSTLTIEQSLQDMHLSPWEMWLLTKERQFRTDLEKKISEDLKLEEERRREQEKKQQKKRLADEYHRQWVQKKLEQERKEKEEKHLKEKQDKIQEAQKKNYCQQKSKEKYQEWINKKNDEEQERKRKEKEEAERRLAEQREKREKAEQMFKEWLEQAKNKPRPTLNSYGYVNGKLTGYYDGSSYPAPSFYNPVPWKPIPIPPPPKEAARRPTGKKKRVISGRSYRSTVVIPCKPKDNLHVGGGMLKR
ncbi:coiled-coil domain-containing protein 34 [Hyperolius riggenbachi]|uniref:coiled-coil domain-containing protein 34 n=1 Tax=Hyperolius riggenbachi TaxID=752182 RepID=UPI0035A35946